MTTKRVSVRVCVLHVPYARRHRAAGSCRTHRTGIDGPGVLIVCIDNQSVNNVRMHSGSASCLTERVHP